MGRLLLEVSKIRSGYGKNEVLHGVSFHVDQSEIICIIGPNGSGKSTVLKTVFGILEAREGHVTFEGQKITNLKPREIIRKGISYIPQGRTVFPTLTVTENLEMGAYIRTDEFEEDIEKIFDIFPILKERKNTKARTLSGGEQQMLVMGRGLMLNPKLILLDEPSLGLAPKLFDLIFNKVKEINSLGAAIILVEQNAVKALELANRGYVLDFGQNKFEGPRTDLLNNTEIQKLYLGY